MNRVLNIFGSLLAIAWATTSCQEEIESVVPGASSSLTDKTVTVEFGAPSSTKGTLEVTNTDITKMTVAFYKKSSGELAVKSPMTEGNRVTVSAANLDEDCSVYAIGNLSEYLAGDEVPWPSNESGLADLGVNPINTVMPKANSVEWVFGTPKVNMNTKDVFELIKQVTVTSPITNKPNETRTIKSIKVTGTPSKIFPFGSASSGDETIDEATASDIALVQNKNSTTFYVPILSSSTKIVTTVECKDGSGITKHETYTKTLSEEEVNSNTNKNPISMPLEGVSDPTAGLTVDIFNEDTREVNFGTSALSVYGDGTEYTTTVKATAGNGDTNWKWILSWTGNSSATGTKITCSEGTSDPVTKDLTSSNYFQLDAGKTYTLKITSSYLGSTQ